MIDTTINLPTLITLGLAIIAAIVWLIRLEGRVSSQTAEITDLMKGFDTLTALVSLHKEQFHEYQLQVSREYMTVSGMSEIKRDLITEIGRMEA